MYQNDEVDVTGIGINEHRERPRPDQPAEQGVPHRRLPGRLLHRLQRQRSPPSTTPTCASARHGVDKDFLANDFLKRLAVPAYGILPPGMPGFDANLRRPEVRRRRPPKPCSTAPACADQLNGQDCSPPARARPPTTSSRRSPPMWQQNLGVTISRSSRRTSASSSRTSTGQVRDVLAGLDRRLPGPPELPRRQLPHRSANNESGYSNPQVDDLLDAGPRREGRDHRGLGLYQQAEQIIVNDEPVDARSTTARPATSSSRRPRLRGATVRHPYPPVRDDHECGDMARGPRLLYRPAAGSSSPSSWSSSPSSPSPSAAYAPGDYVRIQAGPRANPATIERIREERGLNDPVYEQYGRYIWHAFHGDFGTSVKSARRPGEERHLPPALGDPADQRRSSSIFTWMHRHPAGHLGRPQTRHLARPACLSAPLSSSPPCRCWSRRRSCSGFSSKLALLPSAEAGPTRSYFGVHLRHLLQKRAVLPVLVLTLPSVAGLARYMRAQVHRGAGPGLRAHGAGQGLCGGGRRHPPRRAQRHAADRHALGLRAGGADRRLHLRRDAARHPGDRRFPTNSSPRRDYDSDHGARPPRLHDLRAGDAGR